jgi:pimeloyl-ACP methyl ester carboxylesterase
MGKGFFNEYLKNKGWLGKMTMIFLMLVFGQTSGALSAAPSGTIDAEDRIDVYLIPGMGTDYRVFNDFDLEHGNIHYIKWSEPGDTRSLEEYASLLADQIDTGRHYVIVGVSFGGMIGLEISRTLNNRNLILISSAKTASEIPVKYKPARVLPLHHMLGERLLRNTSEKKFMYKDILEPENRHLYRQMLIETGAGFLIRQMDMIVRWKNREYDPGILHIHGTDDRVLPARRIENAVWIEGGTHKMVINHPGTLCRIIDHYLLQLKSDNPSQQDQDG